MSSTSDDGSEHRIWANPVIRAGIIRSSTDGALSNIIRLDKRSFREGVESLYRVQEYDTINKTLDRVVNVVCDNDLVRQTSAEI